MQKRTNKQRICDLTGSSFCRVLLFRVKTPLRSALTFKKIVCLVASHFYLFRGNFFDLPYYLEGGYFCLFVTKAWFEGNLGRFLPPSAEKAALPHPVQLS